MNNRADGGPFGARRWPMRLAYLGVILIVGAGAVVFGMRSEQQAFAALPAPEFSTPVADLDSARSASSFGESASTEEDVAEVPASPVVQLYIPSSDPELELSARVLPMDDCRTVIDPPRDPEGFGEVYGCTDFAQPGTDSTSLSVLAGHSAQRADAAFNRLYRQGASLEGREVYIRTEASGDDWLVYRVDHVYHPAKADLPYMAEVWGEPGASTAGRLILVTCRQEPGKAESVENYVAVAQLVGVRDD